MGSMTGGRTTSWRQRLATATGDSGSPGEQRTVRPTAVLASRTLSVMELAKLSRLQRWILFAAYANRSGDSTADPDLYYHEILAGYFGFPVRWNADKPLHSTTGSHHFDRQAIGRARYHAAQASIGRAVRRLEARGLVERR